MSKNGDDPPRPFSLLVKPASADCNLRCTYCFYLPKAALYPAPRRMSRETLERLIATYMATEQPQYVFGWQGGEPTLMGLEFFQEVVRLQSRYGKLGAVVANGLQTNATRISGQLAELLARYHFLVGVSIDGPEELHDASRRGPGGAGSFREVARGIELLQSHGVAFNALVAVSTVNVDRVEEVYRFLVERGILHHQYIPIVEFDGDGRPLPFTIGAEQWGRFLIRLFAAWYPDRYRVSVRHFDAVLARLVDGTEAVCTMGLDCRS
ncbi:MAG: radical SAM protein, partial [Spirochaetales bacterium]|nr:radical SAM protein [Spirochaetales bacterium]